MSKKGAARGQYKRNKQLVPVAGMENWFFVNLLHVPLSEVHVPVPITSKNKLGRKRVASRTYVYVANEHAKHGYTYVGKQTGPMKLFIVRRCYDNSGEYWMMVHELPLNYIPATREEIVA